MVGEVAGADGTLVMNGGSLTVGTLAYIGFNGTGMLEMNGGTIDVPNGPLVIGRNTGSSGEVLLAGGTITSFENSCIFRDWLPFRSHIEKVHKKVVR